ncbi:hypothetical protein V8E36_006030 [Tilletia maclaganii]
MVDWSSPVQIQKSFEAAIILFWLSIGFTVQDQFSTARFDWDVIVGNRQRRWPQLFYFLVKISWIGYAVINVVLCYANMKINCQATMNGVEAFMGLVTLFSSILLACRTICVYQDFARKVVITVVSVMALGLAAAWFEGVTSVTMVWIPGPSPARPWAEGGCAFAAVSTSYSAKYIVTIVFDFVVLCLTALGVYRLEGSTTKIGGMLLRQGIFYFVLTLFANCLVASFTLAQLNPVMSLMLAVPTSAISVTASTRLYLDLAEETRPSKHRDARFTRENEESYFGTNTGISTDSRKSRSVLGMRFRRANSEGSEKLTQVLPVSVHSSPVKSRMPVVAVQGPTPSNSAEGGVLLYQQRLSAFDEGIEQLGTPVARQEEDADAITSDARSVQQEVRHSRTSLDHGRPSLQHQRKSSFQSNRIHRKKPSLTVLPSAAAAAAALRIETRQTVVTEPMPVHLVGHSFGSGEGWESSGMPSPTQEAAARREYPSLTKSSQGHGSSLT